MAAIEQPHRSLNGSAREDGVGSPWIAAALGSERPYDDPMSKVLGLDAKTSTLRAWFGFTSGSTAMLAAFMVFTSVLAWMQALREREAATIPIEMDVAREEAPPPPPPDKAAAPEPTTAAVRPAAHHEVAPPPPPSPAQAAKVLTREADPNEPVDLTGDSIVQGNADSYAGGFTSGTGNNPNAVHTAPAPTGVPGGTGPVVARVQAPPGPDRSRVASCAGVGAEWKVPFPPEADALQIDDAFVVLQIDVRADGTASDVRVVSETAPGFGREAKRYALRERCTPALDHDGTAIPWTVKQLRVHFNR
jgi:protein TonB